MAKIMLRPTSQLGNADISVGSNRILERADLAIVSVAVPNGEEASLTRALKDSWALSLPDARQTSVSGDTRAIRTASDQLFLVFSHDTPDAEPFVQSRLNGAGYTTDQTDVWVALSVSGPDTLAALERICPLDLDLGVFPVDASARTIMEHMGAFILRLGETEFLLLSPSSSAASFLHAVELSFRYVTHG